ncbi:hypothetical protein HNQ47_000646 [Catenisphaera adipataccumulans]|uniref:Uncharacterized protein n=1 Tax=Catenisphaera adipataccumulans TaxID=700500 RepID=A0A7W8CYI8_9FIRM|nr:hypothetical protein [Catenisphaera adipataccumulans]
MQKKRVREFMARECSWHRSEDMEWISFDGDEGFPESLDKLVFVIKGIGLGILDEMMTVPVKTAELNEDKSAAVPGNNSNVEAKPKRRPIPAKSHVSVSAGMNGPRSCSQQLDRHSLPTVSSSMNGTIFRTGGPAVRLRSVLITLRHARQSKR